VDYWFDVEQALDEALVVLSRVNVTFLRARSAI
jgi:hypothetical protein